MTKYPAGSRQLVAGFVRSFRILTWQRLAVYAALSVLYTGRLLSAMIGSVEGPINWTESIGLALVQSQVRFFPALVLITLVLGLPLRSVPARAVALTSAILVGCGAGFLLSVKFFPDEPGASLAEALAASFAHDNIVATASLLFGWTSLIAMAAAWYFYAERDHQAAAALLDEETARVGLGRRLAEARLQVMQAQIEPHFLFNTLANVRRLYHLDQEGGKAMLQHLSHYLSAALPRMREDGCTLEHELAMASAYLGVQRIRMGERLVYDFDVPDALRHATVPPMMLTTLVENAIKHGLAPLPGGGHVSISARVDAAALCLRVTDTGRGFTTDAGTGVGLANIRARLAALYGGAGRLTIAGNSPRGLTATLHFPLQLRTPAAGESRELAHG